MLSMRSRTGPRLTAALALLASTPPQSFRTSFSPCYVALVLILVVLASSFFEPEYSRSVRLVKVRYSNAQTSKAEHGFTLMISGPPQTRP